MSRVAMFYYELVSLTVFFSIVIINLGLVIFKVFTKRKILLKNFKAKSSKTVRVLRPFMLLCFIALFICSIWLTMTNLVPIYRDVPIVASGSYSTFEGVHNRHHSTRW